MPLAATACPAVAVVPAFPATSTVATWLLWGGLAAAFTALYIGVYVWMRRPKFGEGSPPVPPRGGSEEAGHDAAAHEDAAHEDGAHEGNGQRGTQGV